MIIEISWDYKKLDKCHYQRKVLSFKHSNFLSFQLPLIMITIEEYDNPYSNPVWANAIYASGKIIRHRKEYFKKIKDKIMKLVNYYGNNMIYPY